MFFDDDLLLLIESEFSKNALFKNEYDALSSIEDLKVFIGILIASGNDPKTTERLYWDSEKDMINFLVKEATSRNRFLLIKSFLHINNNVNSSVED